MSRWVYMFGMMLFNVVNNLCMHIRPLVSNHFFKTGDKEKKHHKGVLLMYFMS